MRSSDLHGRVTCSSRTATAVVVLFVWRCALFLREAWLGSGRLSKCYAVLILLPLLAYSMRSSSFSGTITIVSITRTINNR